MQGLERTTVSLARDRLNLTPEQLQSLAEKVQLGDLTPVMQAYKEDICTPVRLALAGTLLRSRRMDVENRDAVDQIHTDRALYQGKKRWIYSHIEVQRILEMCRM